MKITIILALLFIIILLAILYYSKRVIYFLSLVNKRFKKCEIEEIEPKDINRDILVKISKLEKDIYAKGFTRRVILEVKKDKKLSYYKFYYYNLIEGVHANVKYFINSKSDEFYTYFETFFDNRTSLITSNYDNFISEAIPDDIYFIKHPNLDINELYNQHLKDREAFKQGVFRSRLQINNLINLELYRNSEYLNKLAQRGYLVYTDDGYKLTPNFNLFKDSSSLYSSLYHKTKKYIPMFTILAAMIFTILSAIAYFNFTPSEHKEIKSIKPIENVSSELEAFSKKVNSYSGLTLKLNNNKGYTLKEAFTDLDTYLEASKVYRHFAPPLNQKIPDFKNCALPDGLKKVLHWHNGIEKIVPGRNLLEYSTIKKSINSKSSFMHVVAAKNADTGLAFNCKRKGLYEYNLVNKSHGKKEFYDMEHFIKVTAKAYKEKAFFEDAGLLKIDMKKYIKIYRDSFSVPDKNRYSSLIKYLRDRAKVYKISNNNKLKITLLKEMAKTFDPKLIDSAKIFLDDKNRDVRVEAISTLGDIGDKSVIKLLKKFLKSKDKKTVDFALMALEKLVDKDDSYLLNKIHPLLDSSSTLVRISAYRVLAKIANSASLDIIKSKFKHENSAAKLEIIKIISKIGTVNELDLLKGYLDKIENLDFSQKDLMRPRGVQPHPVVLQFETINAINKITGVERYSTNDY